ncbi:hypothetical protein CEUSTIGMA_g800.t1 [Chlamydomonas eustigma]|uniref:PAS domain-containing protein n=1 Tax=Chlamydomonas eustigma TaxID=1157962 RepID=A0A250WR83_9CHLO|nr:hypothetical protein CEUSTIGMA_g800.t1 [Chlamydomonas eustigma]|eukprot:GAX73347.1 hypothetical protein CEUSTIGMA_g800.t1 [Chlamydomonas eustigma]
MSVMGSEAGSNGKPVYDNERGAQGRVDADEDDEGYEKEETSMMKGFYGERIVTWKFVAFKVVFDLWQLLTLTINSQYGWTFDGHATWWQVIDIIQLNYFMSARGQMFFLICLYVFVALLMFTLGLCIWVAWSFKNQAFDYVWPITFLRWFGVIFFQVGEPSVVVACIMLLAAPQKFVCLSLFAHSKLKQPHHLMINNPFTPMPPTTKHQNDRLQGILTFIKAVSKNFVNMLDIVSMTFFLMTLDCQYFGVDPVVIGYNQEFPDQYCWEMPYMIHAAVAAISLVVFVILAAAFQMGELELNMATTNMLGMAHSKAEVLSFLIKFLMTSASVFLNSLEWLSCFYLAGALCLLYLSLMWEPYYHGWVNHARAGVNGALFYSALILVFLVYQPLINTSDPNAVYQFQYNCTLAMIAGLIPAALLAIFASIMRMRYVDAIVEKFRRAPQGVKSKSIHKFGDAREVEMCARCCRKWIDDDTLDERAVDLAYRILKAGMEQLPGDAFMIILYSSFLIDVKKGYQSGLVELNAARKASKGTMEKFALFSREQLHTQKSSGAKGSNGADLVSYVEQQRSYRMALKVNKEAFEATSSFWSSLMKPHVLLTDLTRKVAVLDAKVEEAAVTYRQLLQRSPDNWQLLRMYAVFLEMIRNDPWGAARNYAEADRLMQMEEDAKHNAFLTDSAMVGEMGNMARGADDSSKAVIIMDARCIVQSINKAACDITGYTQKELHGKNVNLLIPRPFSDQHNHYVMKHVTTGETTILDKDTEFVVLHKDRYVLGVTIFITKLSGFGMDSVFMGMFSPLPTPPNTARAWVMGSGVVLSVDATFSDWFGYRPEDLPGAYFSTLVKDTDVLERAFKATRGSDARYAKSASSGLISAEISNGLSAKRNGDTKAVTSVRSLYIKHKYAEPVNCSLEIVNGGGARAHHFFIITITRVDHKPLMVTDGKGKLLHVSKAVADDLGYPIVDLLGELADNVWDVILLEPFSQLHQIHMAHELPAFPPPHSCRSGISVCLLASTDEGPEPRPYKLQVKTRRLDKTGDQVNIVSLEKSSMEKAMDERRLSIITDQQGIITKVGGGANALFGFEPKHMLGKPIAAYVDAFQIEDDKSADEASKHFQAVLVDLAIRSLEAPGESFRVGVTAPLREGSGGSVLSGAIGWHLHARGSYSAVMQVKVHFGEELTSLEASPEKKEVLAREGAQGVMVEGPVCLMSERSARQRRPMNRRTSVMLVDALLSDGRRSSQASNGYGGGPGYGGGRTSAISQGGVVHPPAPVLHEELLQLGNTPPRTPTSMAAKGRLDSPDEILGKQLSQILDEPMKKEAANMVTADVGTGGLFLEIELWRADIMSGMLYLDKAGRVTRTSELPIYQPGLLLGTSDEHMVGLHIGDLLPGMKDKTLDHLFLPDLGRGARTAAKRGGLKTMVHQKHHSKPGPVNIVSTAHFTDGQQVNITAQAINIKRYKNETCLLIHLHKPQACSQDFVMMLQSNPPGGNRVVPDTDDVTVNISEVPRPTQKISVDGKPFERISFSGNKTDSARFKGRISGAGSASFHGFQDPTASTAPTKNRVSLDLNPRPPAGHICMDSSPVPKVEASNISRGSKSRGANFGQPTLEDLVDELQSEDVMSMNEEQGRRINSSEESGSSENSEREGVSQKAKEKTSSWVLSGGFIAPSSGKVLTRRTFPRAAFPPTLEEEEEEVVAEAPSQDVIPLMVNNPLGLQSGVLTTAMVSSQGGGDNKLAPKDDDGASSQGTEDQGLDPAADGQDTDYRRGQRFKKVSRMLTTDAALHGVKMFKYKAYVAIAFVVAVTVASFVTMMSLLSDQTTGVTTLNNIGNIGNSMGEAAVAVLGMGVLFDGRGTPGLPLLETSEDVEAMLQQLHTATTDLANYLQKSYFAVINLPDINGVLSTLWTTASLDISVYQDRPPSGTTLTHQNFSFWDAGKQFLAASQNVWQNAYYRNQTTVKGDSWEDWSSVKFITNNVVNLFAALYSTMNVVVQDVINSAVRVNQVQLILMIVEGVVCSAIATAFMFYINTQVTHMRFNLYSPFVVVPQTIVRSMCKVDLDTVLNEVNKPQETNNDGSPIKFSQGKGSGTSGKFDNGNLTVWEKVLRFLGKLMFWRSGSKVQPSGIYAPKKTLVVSTRTAVYMSTPFVLWGVMMMVINAVGHSQLLQVSNPIAVFDLVNFVQMRYYRTFTLEMAMTIEEDPILKALQRTYLSNNFNVPAEYATMLYGGSAQPQLTAPHDALAREGATTLGTAGDNILYYTHECLRQNQSTCLLPNNTLYQYTANGLDRAMQAHIATMYDSFTMNGTNPLLNSTDFTLIWNLRPDIVGGLAQLNAIYYQYVTSVYRSVLTIHIIGLALSLALMLYFYFFMLRPFLLELTRCRRRIAYLLSTLPPELDVEGLVKRAVALTVSGGSASSGSGATSDINMSMRSSNASLGSSVGSNKFAV